MPTVLSWPEERPTWTIFRNGAVPNLDKVPTPQRNHRLTLITRERDLTTVGAADRKLLESCNLPIGETLRRRFGFRHALIRHAARLVGERVVFASNTELIDAVGI